MRLKKIPLSKATTAWGLLQDVKRAITEEPKRANMETFQRTVLPAQGGPACGTVGCFAGWVGILSGTSWFSVYAILGPNIRYGIVGSEGRSVFNAGGGDACEDTRPGTRAHARAVVQRINKFMRINEVALKARQLPPRTV